ncbi:MAG: AEC family transporter [Lactobacillales bacterium]|jgi:predicted permease|nr:AEC family transporter [Lactobacillales bacterium]
MEAIIHSLAFVIVILLAYFFKARGLMKSEDGFTLTKIVYNITLPATLLSSVRHFKIDAVFFTFIAIGFLLNVIFASVALFLTRKRPETTRAFAIYSLSGYNIGNFAIPFVASVLPAAVPFIGLFDMGNAIMVTGGTTILLDRAIATEPPKISSIFKKLLKAPPFLTYILCIILSLLHLSLPSFVEFPLSFLSSANSFLSMFIIGLFLKFNLDKNYLKLALNTLSWRYLLSTLAALAAWFFLPFPTPVKIALLFAILAPVGNLGVMNATEFGSNEGKVGFTSSLSILISLVIMCLLLLLT